MGKMLSGKTPVFEQLPLCVHWPCYDEKSRKKAGNSSDFFISKSQAVYFSKCKNKSTGFIPFFAKQFHGWVRQLSWAKKVIQIEPFKHDEHAKQKLLLYKGIYFQILLQFFFAKIPFIPQVVMPSWCFSSHISNKRAFLWQFQAQIAAAL